MTKRELSVGVYETTNNFRNIAKHACVCYADDLGLVAVTGPAEDKESQEYADLFAASEDMLEVLEKIEALTTMADRDQLRDWADFGAQVYLLNHEYRAAIKKARGAGS